MASLHSFCSHWLSLFFTESDKSWLGGSLHGNEARGMSTLYSHLVKIAEIVLVTQKVRIGATRTTQLMYWRHWHIYTLYIFQAVSMWYYVCACRHTISSGGLSLACWPSYTEISWLVTLDWGKEQISLILRLPLHNFCLHWLSLFYSHLVRTWSSRKCTGDSQK